MARVITVIVLLVGMMVGEGCAQGVDAWVGRCGGMDGDGGRRARVEWALAALGEAGRGARVRVLTTGGVCAYGWPDGTLFVTRGLVERVSDEELAAALAHELGHLVEDGWVRVPASLRGYEVRGDVEERADAIGVRLLEGAGMGRGVMVSMLGKVAGAPGMSGETRKGLVRRISVLRDGVDVGIGGARGKTRPASEAAKQGVRVP